jgi:hypothetical protein
MTQTLSLLDVGVVVGILDAFIKVCKDKVSLLLL